MSKSPPKVARQGVHLKFWILFAVGLVILLLAVVISQSGPSPPPTAQRLASDKTAVPADPQSFHEKNNIVARSTHSTCHHDYFFSDGVCIPNNPEQACTSDGGTWIVYYNTFHEIMSYCQYPPPIEPPVDSTPPTITVTHSWPDIHSGWVTFSATAIDNGSGLKAGSFVYKLIAGLDTCDTAEMNSDTTSGSSVTLYYYPPDDNRVCFQAEDEDGNKGQQPSIQIGVARIRLDRLLCISNGGQWTAGACVYPPPRVTSVSANPIPEHPYLKESDRVTIRVGFSKDVTLDSTDGSPTLSLSITDAEATYSSQPEDDHSYLDFEYTVIAGHNTPQRDIADASSFLDAITLNLNGAVISDDSDNDLAATDGKVSLSSLTSANKLAASELTVDTTPPVVRVTPLGNRPDDPVRRFFVQITMTDLHRSSEGSRAAPIPAAVNCDATVALNSYRYLYPDSGTQVITIESEAYNNHKICSKVVDLAGNVSYAEGDFVVTGIDRTPPTIIVTPSTDDSSPKREITVSATATDGGSGIKSGSWLYKVIDEADTCDHAEMYRRVNRGNSITLSSESDNNHKVCFSVEDEADSRLEGGIGNKGYQASGVITGIDSTPPTITVTPARNHPIITHEVTVSATATDQGSGIKAGSLSFQVIDRDTSCSAAVMTAPTTGSSIIFNDESYNGKKVCFQVEDQAGHKAYQASGVITGIDTVPPTITVTPASDDSSPKQSMDISAVAQDNLAGVGIKSGSLVYKVIDGADTCGESEMASGTTKGNSVTLNSESDNNHKVCFQVEDYANHKGYQASGIITGIDRTSPTINVSAVTNNQVSATVTDTGDSNPTFAYQILTSGNCDASTGGSFTSYTSGTQLSLSVNQFACFKATDAAGNTAYAASNSGSSDTTPPTITVTYSTTPSGGDYSSPKREIIVLATISDYGSGLRREFASYKLIGADDTCDETEMASDTTAYYSGDSITLDDEAHNNKKACFFAEDVAGYETYQASGIITGIDRTPPTIIVTPSTDDSSPKREITVSATATDGGSGIKTNSLGYKLIDGADTCDSTEMATATTSGSSIDLSSEADNSKKVCFGVEDNLGHKSYVASGIITGIDTRSPTIIVTPSTDDSTPKKEIIVSATATDYNGSGLKDGSLVYKVIDEADTCDESEMATATTSGNSVTLNTEADNSKKVCFGVEDNVGHKSYAASGIITGINLLPWIIEISSDLADDTYSPYCVGACARYQTVETNIPATWDGIITIKVVFDANVTVGGTPTLSLLNTGEATEVASYDSGSGSDTLIFHYPIPAGIDDGSLNVASINLPDGATIHNSVGNAILDIPTGANLADNNNINIDSRPLDLEGYIPTAGIYPLRRADSGEAIDGSGATVWSSGGKVYVLAWPLTGREARFRIYGGFSAYGMVLDDNITTCDDSTFSGRSDYYGAFIPDEDGNYIESPDTAFPIADIAYHRRLREVPSDPSSATVGYRIGYPRYTTEYNGYQFCASITDYYGNRSFLMFHIRGIDTTPPTITVTPASDDSSSKTEIEITARAEDPGCTPEGGTRQDEDYRSCSGINLDSFYALPIDGATDCDAAAYDGVTLADYSYPTDSAITFNSETDNGKKVCFRVADQAGNEAYQASGVITGIDSAPPIITVTPSSDDATPKQEITVSASSADTDVNSATWSYKLIAHDADCNATQMASDTSSGQSVILNSEDHNHHKVCFQVEDQATNKGYAESGTISGLDTTPPTITVTPSSDDSTAKTTITVSATATDGGSGIKSGSWLYKVIDGADTCDSSQMSSGSSSGNSLTLSSEADNSKKVCFQVEDNLAHVTYAPSGVISGLDRTPPTIIVTPASDDASPKTAITVSASSTDPDLGATPAWIHKVISDSDTCDSTQMTSDSSSGNSISLNTEAHNHHKVCFSVEDNLGNKAYQASGVITGLDRTDPVINVSSVINNQVSASVTETFLASFGVQQLTSGSCSSSTPGSFSNYHSGDTLTLVDGETACFKATDTAGNTSYEASSSGLDITPPTIIVTPASDDASPKTAITVSATSTDPDLGATPAWIHKVISDSDTCDSTQMTSDSSSGNSISLNTEAHNHHKVCFSVSDTNANPGYGVSGTISGLDTTPPTITVTPASDDSTAKTTITVSATATDGGSGIKSGSWLYKVIDGADSCDSTEMATATTSGNSVTLNTEAQNNHRVCFQVEDNLAHITYAPSGVISGLDRTPPTIIVTPASDDASPKTAITVSATSTDPDLGATPAWIHKVISDSDTCDSTQMTSDSSSGNSISLNTEAHNHHKVCFSVEDNLGNKAYQASGVITGLDRTDPVINVSSVINNQVSASVTETFLASFGVQQLTSGSCSSSTPGSFSNYHSGDTLTLVDGETACFKATDTAGNTSYEASSSGLDITPPTIIVTPASDDASPKTAITVSATSTDPDLGATPAWIHKVISDSDTCDSTEMTSDSSSGNSISLNTEAHNHHKVCFSVSDTNANPGYGVSGLISGLDTTPPTITVTPASDDSTAKTTITVSATATDGGSGIKSGSWLYKVIDGADTCDSSQMSSGSSSGNSLTLSSEADNSKKVCFQVEDNLAHVTYAPSGVISGLDRTPPTIIVTPASDDASPKTAITVSASSTDPDLGATPAWIHKVISDSDTCDSTEMTSDSSSGNSISLNSESDNSKKVCFSVEDNLGNKAYQASGVITGLDRTDPVINVSSVTNNQVSASVTETFLASFGVQQLTSGSCSSSTPGSFSNYHSGDTLTLVDGETACFKATDTAGNTAYAASTVGTDITPPTIIVTPASDDASPKTAITVSASSTDPDLGATPAWIHKVISDSDTCDSTEMTSDSSSGNSITLNSEAHNHHKVCFSVSDTNANPGYGVSGLISGLDTTPPTITVTPSSDDSTAKTTITVSATATDGGSGIKSGSWLYKVIDGADSCDSTEMATATTSGSRIDLNTEAQNNHRVCFGVEDNVGHKSYAASGIISGIDRTPPTIIVTPASDDASPKTAITVSASSTDPDLGATPAWIHKVISDSDTCDSTQMTSGTSSGQSVTLNSEAHNHHKVCFSVSDTNSNPGYGVSGTISGLDTTPPTITVTPASDDSTAKTTITVSATATDGGSGIKSGSWLYKVIDGADTCDSSQMSSGSSSGNSVTLNTEAQNNHRVCFQVEDNLAHITYAPSGVISGLDRTPPTIIVTPASDDASPKTAITVSASSTDPDLGATPAWIHKVISDSDTCDSTEMSSDSSSGNSISLNTEAHNHHKVCFSVEDNLGNKAYQASGVITGLDRTDPVINVSSVTNNQVSASVTETFLASFGVQQLTSGSCSSSTPGSFSNYHSGDTLTLVDGETACFKATDTAGNTSYEASSSGLDITPPTIIVTPASDDASPKTAITVSASSTDPDLGATPAWIHKVISDSDTCDSTEMTSDSSSGQSVTLNSEAHNHHKVCFSVSDTNANPGYGVSGLISGLDTTPPTITVTPASDDSTAKTTITVSATATDGGSGIKSGSWLYKVIDGADTCDSTEMATATSSGNSLTLSSEADNSKKVCFQVEDNLAHVTYAPSGVISGLDRTPPTIIVTPSSDDSTAKTAITVSASSTDPDLGATPAWIHKVISDSDTCDSTEMTSDSSSGNSISLNSESDNSKKVCFSVEDNLGNKAYQASGVITGLDRTDPVINVSSVTNNQVSASVTETFLASFGVQQLTSGSCSSSTPGSFSNYHSGDTLTLVDGETACFKATDTAGNTAYAASTVGTDITPPTIIVTPASDDASPKTAITVSASSTDPDLGATPAWIHKVISDSDTCDSTEMTSDSSSGQSVTLNSEAHNHHKVCFSVSDTNANPGYGVSGLISGLDTTPPTITVTPSSDDSTAKTTITVSATATDGGSGIKSGSWLYKVIDGADTCDSSQMSSGSSSGNSLTLSSEADNSKKVCFQVEDNLAHVTYAPSGVISGLDRTPPTIIVTPSSDDSTAKTAITVSASSTDPDLGATPAWIHKVISDSDTCDSTEMTSDSSSGNSISLNSESDNSKKVCFSVEDNLGNKAYQASGVITGLDRTDPVINVSSVINNQVSASVTETFLASFGVQQLTSGSCSSSTPGSFSNYHSGDTLTLVDGETACFKATDTAGNTSYEASSSGLDITPPTIIVTPASDDASPKTAITVSASSTDPDLGATPAWIHKVISDSDTCDSTEMTSDSSSGQSVTLNSEAHNHHKVCFSVSDTNANPGYGVSGLISGLDTTPPTITVTPSSDDSTAKTTITVSATATDGGSGIKSGSWLYKVIDGADSCDSTEMATATTSGSRIDLNTEAQNNHRVCFGVEDNVGHKSYAASGIISGIDRTPPTIIVTPASDDASPKTAITVSASSTDPDLGATPAWIHKVISDSDTCDSTQMTSGTSSGQSVTLNSEAHNHHKVCFSVSDTNSNPGYGVSGTISGLDTTPPTITVTPASDDSTAKTTITVSATATDGGSGIKSGSWLYKVIDGADTCDSSQMSSGSSSGNSVTLNTEAQNNHRVCFQVEDNLAHITYAPSGVISGLDRTPPTIIVTPASDDASPKTAITVSASSTDPDLGATPAWIHKVISDSDTCDSTEMSSDSSSGNSISLNTEAHNHHKVCFSVEDNLGNKAYQASGVITGLDRTDPVINVSSVTNNQVSASVTETFLASFGVQQLTSGSCSSSTPGSFSNYHSGDTLTLVDGETACFKATDTAGNTSYEASSSGLDITPPTIIVTPASDDASPKTAITVSASSTDPDLGATPAWIHKVISDSDTCDSTEMTSDSSSGQSVTLNSEAHNHHKVCFSVSDTNANPGYGVSGLISGLDTTPPTITVTPASDDSTAKTTITVSATATDGGSGIKSGSWLYKVIDGADTCDSTEMATATSSGNSLTLSSEADNSKKVCFQVEDNLAHVTYAPSGVISGLDRTPPTIIVTPSSDDSTAKTAITVSASSTDPDLGATPAWIHKVISDSDTCDSTEMTSDSSSGNSISLNSESDNSKKVCFSVEDNLGNKAYQASGVITGLDRTDPVINVSSVTNNQVSASVTETFLASFGVQQLTSGSCSSSTPGSFSNYHSGDTLTLVDGETACFKATDTAGNTAYAASTVGTDITPPTIIVTPASDDASPKTAITVSASSTDPDLGATPAWIHKVISDSDTCDSTEMTSDSSSGQSVTLNSEAHNHHKVCFSVSDTNANPGYGVSGLISGLDTTPPTITVTPSSDDSTAKTTITVSATATDGGSGIKSGSWLYKVIDGADTCDSSQMSSGSSSGNSLTLSSEADNSKKVCFQVEDNLAHVTYAPSGVISGLDRTPPTIIVTPSSDDSTAKTAITVSASSTDPDLGATPAWIHKVISDSDTCDSTEMTSDSSSGNSISLNSESDNSKKVCFSVEDNLGNKAYQASGVITGLDRTDPVINVSSVINNQVSASVTETFLASFGVQQLTSGSCSSSTPGSFSNYHSGDTLTLVDGETACFKATDTAGNTSYEASSSGLDITPPTIIVTPASDDASPKTAITVSASSTDPDLGATPAWIHKVISDSDTCDSTEMTSDSSSGQSVTLNSEAHNHHKVCFSVSDTNANPGYGVSGLISGLDTTPPTITVTPSSDDSTAKTTITVSATATDGGSGIKSGSWLYKVIDGADSCDSTEMATATTSGSRIDLNTEAQNNHRVCFGVEDNVGHKSYAASGIISGIDRTPPTIIVTPASDDASPKTAITVSASSTDPDLGATPAWIHKVISDSDTCDSTQMTSGTSSGQSVTLNSEAHNHHKVCFSVEDNLGNKAYQASGLITGLDRTDPVINVSSVTNNQVSASVTDNSGTLSSFQATILTSGNCDSSTTTFTDYSSGNSLTLAEGETACFKATDTAGNTSYEASSSGLDITPPTIIVTPASDDASPKTAITVSASSTDPDLGATPAWIHKVISDSDTCDSTEMTSDSSSGQSVTLNSEAHNHHKVCFSVSDTNANPGYGVSGTISGLDTTPPTITVTPASDDSTAKTTITVSATATDQGSGIKSGSWLYKVIDGADSCDSTEMATATTSGNSLTLSSEADNSKKVCFQVEDNLAHVTYAPSGVISGLDRTDPVIDVSSVVNNQLSATVSDNLDDNPSFTYQLLSSGNCDSTTEGSFATYNPGSKLTLSLAQTACFKALDAAGNVTYAASSSGTDPTASVGTSGGSSRGLSGISSNLKDISALVGVSLLGAIFFLLFFIHHKKEQEQSHHLST